MRNPLFTFATAALLAGSGVSVEADLLRLHNGGEVRGTLRPGHTRDARLTIDTLTGGVVVIDREEVQFTTVRRPEIEHYERKARTVAPTIAAHWELAEWCRENRLASQREEQLEQVLLLDPDHAEARRAMGQVYDRGQWVTREEQLLARGYILYNGKYYTAQELELIEQNDVERGEEKEWYTRLSVWVKWVAGSNDRQRQQGLAALRKVNDPTAVRGLTAHMAEHSQPAVRRLMVDILATIPGEKPVRPLVDRSLFDGDAAIRYAALQAISPDQQAAAVAAYVTALRHSDNRVVNRAGHALGELRDPRTVPALIDALVTQHSFPVKVPVKNNITLTRGPQGATFSDPRQISQYLPPDIELALRAGQLPFGVKVNAPPPTVTSWRTYQVQAPLQNVAVLTALKSLTDQDFGYDERIWKLWWAAEGQKFLSAS